MKDGLCTNPVLCYQNFKVSFILPTGASKSAIAVILSQVQERVERRIVCASMQLNNAEQAYSASKAETLIFLWATSSDAIARKTVPG